MNSTERDLPEHASRDEDYKRIWLSPACDDERTWCQDDQGPCDECGAPSVEYVRADALASIRAERDAAVAALKQCSNIFEDMYRYGVVYTPPDDGTPHLEPVGAYYLGAGVMPMIARAIAGEQKNG